MRRFGVMAAIAVLLTATGVAWAAKSWNLTGEEIVRFEAKVVDLLCEITGDCPADCGGGKRQLGLLKDDGVLIPVTKNMTAFTGATEELMGFCGKKVTADGLLSSNHGTRVMALHFVKETGEGGKWQKANRYLGVWADRNGVDPAGKKPKQWFRHDPRIKMLIERDGFLGLGPEEDKKFLADY